MKNSLRLLFLFLFSLSLLSISSFAQESTEEATAEATTEANMGTTGHTGPGMETLVAEIVSADFDGPAAFVRIINLTSDNVDVFVNNELSDTADLAFTESGNWLVVPAGNHTFAVGAAGGTAESATTSLDVSLTENEPLIIIIYDGAEGPAVLLVRDNYEDVAPGVATFNFVNTLNGAEGVNFLLDDVVYVSAVSAASEGMTEVNNSINVDAATYTISATYFGTDEPVNVEAFELAARDEDNYLIVLAGTEEAPQLLVFETPQAQVSVLRGEMEAPGTILDALRANGYESFVTMLEEAGLAETLTGEGPYTLFVPADYLMDELAASGEDLSNYIVEGDIRSSDVTLFDGQLTTMGGLGYNLGVNNDILSIGNAQIIDVNIEASNGTIHIINDLLTSPDFSEATPEATQAADG
jgi:uncharacterized surface protein with fasciclin (FAS1) repeats